MSETWRLSRCQELCSRCAAPFAAEEDLWSLLCLAGGELGREDLCRRCFDAHDAADDLIWWRTRARRGAAALRVDFDLLLHAMAKLAEDTREEAKDLAFLLALLLVRHRRLRLLRVEKRRGEEILVLRKVRTTREFPVAARELTEERRQSLSATLAGLLDPTQEAGLDGLLSVEDDASD